MISASKRLRRTPQTARPLELLLLLLLLLLLQALTLWLQFRSKCNQNEGCYEFKINLAYRLKYGEQKW
jgi:hypothetical protein